MAHHPGVIRSADDLEAAVQWAGANPKARWYVSRMARAYKRTDLIPESWDVKNVGNFRSQPLSEEEHAKSVEVDKVIDAFADVADDLHNGVATQDQAEAMVASIAAWADQAGVLDEALESLTAGAGAYVEGKYLAAAEMDALLAAGDTVRKVRTPAGVKRYNAPIGTPIVKNARTGKLEADRTRIPQDAEENTSKADTPDMPAGERTPARAPSEKERESRPVTARVTELEAGDFMLSRDGTTYEITKVAPAHGRRGAVTFTVKSPDGETQELTGDATNSVRILLGEHRNIRSEPPKPKEPERDPAADERAARLAELNADEKRRSDEHTELYRQRVQLKDDDDSEEADELRGREAAARRRYADAADERAKVEYADSPSTQESTRRYADSERRKADETDAKIQKNKLNRERAAQGIKYEEAITTAREEHKAQIAKTEEMQKRNTATSVELAQQRVATLEAKGRVGRAIADRDQHLFDTGKIPAAEADARRSRWERANFTFKEALQDAKDKLEESKKNESAQAANKEQTPDSTERRNKHVEATKNLRAQADEISGRMDALGRTVRDEDPEFDELTSTAIRDLEALREPAEKLRREREYATIKAGSSGRETNDDDAITAIDRGIARAQGAIQSRDTRREQAKQAEEKKAAEEELKRVQTAMREIAVRSKELSALRKTVDKDTPLGIDTEVRSYALMEEVADLRDAEIDAKVRAGQYYSEERVAESKAQSAKLREQGKAGREKWQARMDEQTTEETPAAEEKPAKFSQEADEARLAELEPAIKARSEATRGWLEGTASRETKEAVDAATADEFGDGVEIAAIRRRQRDRAEAEEERKRAEAPVKDFKTSAEVAAEAKQERADRLAAAQKSYDTKTVFRESDFDGFASENKARRAKVKAQFTDDQLDEFTDAMREFLSGSKHADGATPMGRRIARALSELEAEQGTRGRGPGKDAAETVTPEPTSESGPEKSPESEQRLTRAETYNARAEQEKYPPRSRMTVAKVKPRTDEQVGEVDYVFGDGSTATGDTEHDAFVGAYMNRNGELIVHDVPRTLATLDNEIEGHESDIKSDASMDRDEKSRKRKQIAALKSLRAAVVKDAEARRTREFSAETKKADKATAATKAKEERAKQDAAPESAPDGWTPDSLERIVGLSKANRESKLSNYTAEDLDRLRRSLREAAAEPRLQGQAMWQISARQRLERAANHVYSIEQGRERAAAAKRDESTGKLVDASGNPLRIFGEDGVGRHERRPGEKYKNEEGETVTAKGGEEYYSLEESDMIYRIGKGYQQWAVIREFSDGSVQVAASYDNRDGSKLLDTYATRTVRADQLSLGESTGRWKGETENERRARRGGKLLDASRKEIEPGVEYEDEQGNRGTVDPDKSDMDQVYLENADGGGSWASAGSLRRVGESKRSDRQARIEDRKTEKQEKREPAPAFREETRSVSDLQQITMDTPINEAHAELLARRYRRDGFIGNPIQIEEFGDGSQSITDGHHRLEGARRAGITDIPVRVYSASTEGRDAARSALVAQERNKAEGYDPDRELAQAQQADQEREKFDKWISAENRTIEDVQRIADGGDPVMGPLAQEALKSNPKFAKPESDIPTIADLEKLEAEYRRVYEDDTASDHLLPAAQMAYSRAARKRAKATGEPRRPMENPRPATNNTKPGEVIHNSSVPVDSEPVPGMSPATVRKFLDGTRGRNVSEVIAFNADGSRAGIRFEFDPDFAPGSSGASAAYYLRGGMSLREVQESLTRQQEERKKPQQPEANPTPQVPTPEPEPDLPTPEDTGADEAAAASEQEYALDQALEGRKDATGAPMVTGQRYRLGRGYQEWRVESVNKNGTVNLVPADGTSPLGTARNRKNVATNRLRPADTSTGTAPIAATQSAAADASTDSLGELKDSTGNALYTEGRYQLGRGYQQWRVSSVNEDGTVNLEPTGGGDVTRKRWNVDPKKLKPAAADTPDTPATPSAAERRERIAARAASPAPTPAPAPAERRERIAERMEEQKTSPEPAPVEVPDPAPAPAAETTQAPEAAKGMSQRVYRILIRQNEQQVSELEAKVTGGNATAEDKAALKSAQKELEQLRGEEQRFYPPEHPATVDPVPEVVEEPTPTPEPPKKPARKRIKRPEGFETIDDEYLAELITAFSEENPDDPMLATMLQELDYRLQRDADLDRINELIAEGYEPAEAEAEVTGKSIDSIRRRESVRWMRDTYTITVDGNRFEEILTQAYAQELEQEMMRAEAATNGYMQNPQAARRSMGRGNDILWTGNERTARAQASEELREYWDQHGRLTKDEFRRRVLAAIGAANGPNYTGADFLQ